jgi:hypothetical protein
MPESVGYLRSINTSLHRGGISTIQYNLPQRLVDLGIGFYGYFGE